MDEKTLRIDISFGTVVKTIFFLILLWVLFILHDLVLVVLMAIVVASGIEPGAQWFIRYRVPRVLSVLIVYIGIFVAFAGLVVFFIPPLIDEVKTLADQLPQEITSAEIVTQATNSVGAFADDILPGGVGTRIFESLAIGDALKSAAAFADQYNGGFIKIASVIFGGTLSFILIIVISFYLSMQDKGIEKFLRIIMPPAQEDYVISLWNRSQIKIALWVKGQLILAFFVGMLVYLSLSVFGIKYAFILAVLAAAFELIPIFGPILAAIPALVIAFLDGGSGSFFVVAILYIVIQQFENQLLYPLVVRQGRQQY